MPKKQQAIVVRADRQTHYGAYFVNFDKLQQKLDEGWTISRVDKVNYNRANDCLIYILEKDVPEEFRLDSYNVLEHDKDGKIGKHTEEAIERMLKRVESRSEVEDELSKKLVKLDYDIELKYGKEHHRTEPPELL